jgi:hypothetical protein
MTQTLSPPRRSAGPSPARIPGSVRRTSSIDITWPEARAGRMRFVGRARDLLTPAGGAAPVVLAMDGFEAVVGADRTIESIAAEPPRPALARLVGARGGGGFRRALAEALPEERRLGTPLYLILDDVAPSTLIATAAWLQWDKDSLPAPPQLGEEQMATLLRKLVGVCVGHAPGASSNEPEGARRDYGDAPAADLPRAEDPASWHPLEAQKGASLRRARRIDVRLGEVIVVDSEFQDSVTRPGGGRATVHEYGVRLTADPLAMTVLSIEATPRVLPYPECAAAPANLLRLVGSPLGGLRETVLVEFAGIAGCTHLNDAIRALAEVPTMLQRLR